MLGKEEEEEATEYSTMQCTLHMVQKNLDIVGNLSNLVTLPLLDNAWMHQYNEQFATVYKGFTVESG